MATPVDDYIRQCGQLSAYLRGRREPIINQWEATYSPSEAGYIQAGTDQRRGLLDLFPQRITDEPKARERVEPPDPYESHRWPEGYTLAKVITELTNFYDIVDLEIQQFLALYPHTQSLVVNQAYRQLGRLSNEVTKRNVLYSTPKQPNPDSEPLKARQPIPAIRHLDVQLHQTSHDLRASFGIIASAASLLLLPLKDSDRANYLAMITRNVTIAEHHLHQLVAYLEEGCNS
ncbi:hypothetical protein GO755_37105 [Spirosoma sp. HMF4905]|uniref:Uncharacterized protein n=1 Tax=Spirosoma arboris TaxID=2682092 RepID=A0A7K1SPT1_9BACT|nr:hypothetical protein [Spirosoma arboris]MVM35693.1 hypothetical protein [Spirosoma arboris]